MIEKLISLEKQAVKMISLGESIINDIREMKNEIKPKLEVGKWYKDTQGVKMWFVESIEHTIKHTSITAYGINGVGNWSESLSRTAFRVGKDGYKLATDAEVEAMLIKEAKERGVWDIKLEIDAEGDRVSGNFSGSYNSIDNRLFSPCMLVFSKGNWVSPPESIPEYTIQQLIEKVGEGDFKLIK